MAERKNTTMSGQPRSKKSYGLREFLDDYGPMSNITRLLKGHDDEIPSMPAGLGGLGFDALGKDPKAPGIAELKEAELKAFAKILERRKKMKRDKATAAAKAKITKAEGKAKKKKQSKMHGGKVHRGRTAIGNKD